jgi:hypothetical protein
LVAVNLYFFPLHFLNITVAQACERREQGGVFEFGAFARRGGKGV